MLLHELIVPAWRVHDDRMLVEGRYGKEDVCAGRDRRLRERWSRDRFGGRVGLWLWYGCGMVRRLGGL